MNKYIKVSASTKSACLNDIVEELSSKVGRRLFVTDGAGVPKNTRILITGDKEFVFFVSESASCTTLYAEDNRFGSYEECLARGDAECSIVDKIARENGGFDVTVECYGSCVPPKGAVDGVLRYKTSPGKNNELLPSKERCPANMVRVSATTSCLGLSEIKDALETYVGQQLRFCDHNTSLSNPSIPCICTDSHFYEFFHRMESDGSATIYDEDGRFESYEECRSQGKTGCAIVERLANDMGGFSVKIECAGNCTLLRGEVPLGYAEDCYTVPPKERCDECQDDMEL